MNLPNPHLSASYFLEKHFKTQRSNRREPFCPPCENRFRSNRNTLIFGLPGNPVSVAVTFHSFVRRAILQMQGAKTSEPQKGFAVLQHKIKGAKERDSFLPVFVETDKKGKLIVESLRFGGSSNFIAYSRANALVFVPKDETLEAGEVAEIVFL